MSNRSFIIAAVVCVVGIVTFWLATLRGKAIVQKWAAANDFEILRAEPCLFTGGSGMWQTPTSRNQIIYSVRVRDRAGQERSGWLRIGSFFGGIMFGSERAEVKWKHS
jgi:hypothetical protein